MFTATTEPNVGTEDSDACPALEVAATDKGRTVAYMLVDEPAQLLWVADKEGWVYGERAGGTQGRCCRACWALRPPPASPSLPATAAAAPLPLPLQRTSWRASRRCRCGRGTAPTSSRRTAWAT